MDTQKQMHADYFSLLKQFAQIWHLILPAPSAAYLNFGSGFAGIKDSNDSGIISLSLWWYDNLQILKYMISWIFSFDLLYQICFV